MSRSFISQPLLLRATVLLGGLATLTVELAAARLLGAFFGVSNIVWTTIIGLILVYLALGYYLGGRLADRYPHQSTFYMLAIWGAFLSGFVPFVGQILLPVIAEFKLPLPLAVTIAIAILYTLPIMLLGCLSPFAIRLTFKSIRETGTITGTIYAFSTLGSIMGSLAPGLYALPTLGTTRTYIVFNALLLIVALIGLLRENRTTFVKHIWMPIVFVALISIAP